MQHPLHFFGGLVLVILAEVAVAAGQSDVLDVGRYALGDEILVLLLTALKARPTDQEDMVLLLVVAGDHLLDRRVGLDDTGEKGPLVHVVEAGRELQTASQIADDIDVRRLDQLRQELDIVENEVAETIGSLLVESIPLHGRQHRAENLRPENIGEVIIALLAQPEQQFAAGAVLADKPDQLLLEQLPPVLEQQEPSTFTGQLRADIVDDENELGTPIRHRISKSL